MPHSHDLANAIEGRGGVKGNRSYCTAFPLMPTVPDQPFDHPPKACLSGAAMRRAEGEHEGEERPLVLLVLKRHAEDERHNNEKDERSAPSRPLHIVALRRLLAGIACILPVRG